jgi:gas vesicle protein
MAEDDGSKVVYFLAGLALGALAGLIFIPPKSGKETRDLLAKKAEEGRENAWRKSRELRERADELIERCREAAGPHGPGQPPPDDDDDETQQRKSSVDQS